MIKAFLRRVAFDYIDKLPAVISNVFANFIVKTQSSYFINELKLLNKYIENNIENNDEDLYDVRNILIVRLDAIGDIVWTTAFLRELRANYKNAKINLILRPVAKKVLENCPYINNMYTYDCLINNVEKKENFKLLKVRAMLFMTEHLKKIGKYDMVFLPREVFMNNGIENLYLGIFSNAPIRVGRTYYTNALEKARAKYIEPLFTNFTKLKNPKHETLQILDELKTVNKKIKNDNLELWMTDKEVAYARKWINNKGIKANSYNIIIGLYGSSPNRSWKSENYLQLTNRLKSYNGNEIKYILVGDRKISKKINFPNNVIDISGQTSLREVIAIISIADMYVGSDTGLMHIATAFKLPVVEISAHLKNGRIMDSGSPVLVGPWKVPSEILEPAYGKDGCVGWCTKNYSHCINQISVNSVIKAVCNLLERTNNGYNCHSASI